MSTLKAILFDIDGVLADWVWGFTNLLHERISGLIEPVHTGEQFDWNLTHIDKAYMNAGWNLVQEIPWWWRNLDPLATEAEFKRIANLNLNNRVYFPTARAEGTPHVLRQTRQWLEIMGIVNPSVVITKKKGEFANLVQADFAIDDKPENVACIHWLSEGTQTYLLDYPKLGNKDFLPKAVKRIASLSKFLDDVEVAI